MHGWRKWFSESLKQAVSRPTIYTPSEQNDHRTIADWLDRHGLVWTHPPMGGYRRRIEAAIMHGLGARAGIPDFLVFTPPPGVEANGVAIELKRQGRQLERNGGVSEDQMRWLDQLEGCGWLVRVCYGADEAMRLLEAVGYSRRRAAR